LRSYKNDLRKYAKFVSVLENCQCIIIYRLINFEINSNNIFEIYISQDQIKFRINQLLVNN